MAVVENNEVAAPEMVKLQSNDGVVFEVSRELTKHSLTLNNLFRVSNTDLCVTVAVQTFTFLSM